MWTFKFDEMDFSAGSLTIDATGLSENTYNIKKSFESPQVKAILATLYEGFPETLKEDATEWEMVGLTQSNGDNYLVDTISVFYRGGPSPSRLAEFATPPGNYINAHTIKYELKTKKRYLKVFDGDWWKYPLPSLPQEACFGEHGGIGVHYANARLTSRRDIYFFHRDEKWVRSWCADHDLMYPDYVHDPGGPILRLYGLAFDQQTLKPIKLKRYVHPYQLDVINKDI